jgi:hypothetical protein
MDTIAGMVYVVVWMVTAVVFACLGAYVASQCGRWVVEGVSLGFLFGPLGVLVVAVLPRGRRSNTDPAHRTTDDRAVSDFLGKL